MIRVLTIVLICVSYCGCSAGAYGPGGSKFKTRAQQMKQMDDIESKLDHLLWREKLSHLPLKENDEQ